MPKEKKMVPVFVQIVERPARKLLVRRGVKASYYHEYCRELGCDVWDILYGVKEALYEPVGLRLPERLRKGGSEYVQGVELPLDYTGPVPEGFELTELAPCKMMVFQGPPYDDDLYVEAVGELWAFIHGFDPRLYGYEWAMEEAPRFQLAPMGYRGCIEARPVRPANK